MTRIFICKFPPYLISHRYSGAAKTEWKLGFTLLSRVRISQRQITEIYYPRNTEKIKVKETLWGRCSSAFSSLIYLLWYALGLYYQERIIKKLCEHGIKISVIKLNNIKYWIKAAKTLAFRGCHVVYLYFKPRMISKTRKKPLKPKNKQKYITTKKSLMFTKQVIQHAIWSRQKDHDFPIASRSVPVNFSLGPRSSLVRLSFVIR